MRQKQGARARSGAVQRHVEQATVCRALQSQLPGGRHVPAHVPRSTAPLRRGCDRQGTRAPGLHGADAFERHVLALRARDLSVQAVRRVAQQTPTGCRRLSVARSTVVPFLFVLQS